jgi:aspartate 1-decarboxylase
MGIIAFLLARFIPHTQFHPNERVNLVEYGNVARYDGVVIAETPQGVLVEWPKGGGSRLSAPGDLVRLVA